MSIPERLYRIAKYKLGEIKDRLERLDEESQQSWEANPPRRPPLRDEARRELDETLRTPAPSSSPSSSPSPSSLRSPEEIVRGTRSTPSASPAPASRPVSAPSAPDPLAYHYRLLGVESGADFATVQAAYNKLAARSDASRFPAGSEEAQQAQQIRERLETSYKALRDALDPTARRFDLLEFDAPSSENKDDTRGPTP